VGVPRFLTTFRNLARITSVTILLLLWASERAALQQIALKEHRTIEYADFCHLEFESSLKSSIHSVITE